MSPPRPSAVGQFGVATWSFEVATWGRLPGRVATSTRPASTRPALACARYARDQLAVRAAAPTTWALHTQCAHDLGSGCAHCAPNPVL